MLHSSTDQELFKKYLWNLSNHYEPCRQFPLWKELIKRFSLTVIKQKKVHDECICTYCGMPKDISWHEAILNCEKIKSVPLSIVKLH